MGTASQIRSYRVRAGKSAGEVAKQLGLNAAWYDDLEQHDDELAATLTLFQALELASILNARLSDLVSEGNVREENIEIVDLPARINAHVEDKGISIEQLEDEVGWELREFLKAPIRVSAELPIKFLQALASALGIGWLSLVPDEHRCI